MNDAQRRSTRVASSCAMSMVAWQVAGSAIRDSSFLTHFDVTSLPIMVVASGAASMGLVGIATRAMSRRSPDRFMVGAFSASALLTAALWVVSLWRPDLAAVGLYLQVAVIGAVLLSGFWSVVSEYFDPRAGKRSFMIIGRAATAGGLIGGVAAERVATWLGHDALLPMLVGLHALCAFEVGRIGAPLPPPTTREEGPSAVKIFVGRGYLRHLGLLVLLLTIASVLLDYWFKAQVVQVWSGDELVAFFAWFYTGMSLLTFGIQMVVAHWTVKKLGLARVTALLPVVIAAGGIAGLLVPGMWTAGTLRMGHTSLKHSVFQLAYELLYIPLDAQEKRRTKAFIDVGFRRAGDVLGGLLISAILLMGASSSQGMLVAMIAIALGAIGVTVVLDRGYVRELERSLMRKAGKLNPYEDMRDALTAEVLTRTLGTTDLSQLDAGTTAMLLSRSVHVPPADAASTSAPSPSSPPRPASRSAPIPPAPDQILADVADLRSGDHGRVIGALLRATGPEHVGHLIPLLAWDSVSKEVADVLRRHAPRATGQLIDALTDPQTNFTVRRRIPRILAGVGGPRVVDGLLMGLRDPRFEVRFQCSGALLKLRRADESVVFDRRLVTGLVLREAEVERSVWEGRRLLDRVEAEGDSWLAGSFLRARSNRSMEHVFALLALILPPDPVTVAYRGLQTEDPALMGTALEYLDHVLPPEVRDRLWPLLTDRPAGRAPGSSEQALDALLKSHRSIQMHLQALQKAHPGGSAPQ